MTDIEREAFEKWFGSRVWPTTMQPSAGDKARMFISWQAARTQQGETEPVAYKVDESLFCHRRTAEVVAGQRGSIVEPVYTHPPTGTGGVPGGWRVWRDGQFIRIDSPADAHIELRRNDALPNHYPLNLFFDLAEALLTAAPSPEQTVHWAAQNPGAADQFRCEALAVRDALGFSKDDPNVAPVDLREAIGQLKGKAAPGSEWVRCSERLPTETDGYVWSYDGIAGTVCGPYEPEIVSPLNGETHWMPTGLKRPNPPAEGE